MHICVSAYKNLPVILRKSGKERVIKVNNRSFSVHWNDGKRKTHGHNSGYYGEKVKTEEGYHLPSANSLKNTLLSTGMTVEEKTLKYNSIMEKIVETEER